MSPINLVKLENFIKVRERELFKEVSNARISGSKYLNFLRGKWDAYVEIREMILEEEEDDGLLE